MPEHKEICLLINDKQSVKLKSVSVPFKIYPDFDCVLKGVKSNDKNKNTEKYTEKYQDHLSCYFAYKRVCIDDNFSKRVALYRGKKCSHVYRRWRKM